MVKRVQLTNEFLAISKPGFDVTTLAPTDYDELAFHSDWARVEYVHQIGAFAFTTGALGSGQPNGAYIPFPTLSYIPQVTYRRRNSLSGGIMYADEWYRLDTAGVDDPCRAPYRLHPFVDGFLLVRDFGGAVNAGGLSDVGAFRGHEPSTTFYFNYIVWNIPANAVVSV